MDYQQTSGTATSWRRAFQININNRLDATPSIHFVEEDVVSLGERQISQASNTVVTTVFDPPTVIPLLNPVDGTPLGTTATHADFEVLLYSLYIQGALARDAAAG